MRAKANWFPLYCDDTCNFITLNGTWTKTKKGGCFCQRHAAMVATCANCGKKFHSQRVHTATCGDKCRKAISRKRVQIGSVT